MDNVLLQLTQTMVGMHAAPFGSIGAAIFAEEAETLLTRLVILDAIHRRNVCLAALAFAHLNTADGALYRVAIRISQFADDD